MGVTDGILGLIATTDRPEFWIPRSFRAQILKEYPRGDSPLFALTSMMKQASVSNSKFEWVEKDMPELQGAITGRWTNVALDAAYAGAGVAGDVLYIQCAQATAQDYIVGKMAALQDASHTENMHIGYVVDVTYAGADSYVAVQLIEDDDNGVGLDADDEGDVDIAQADVIRVAGNSISEGNSYLQAMKYDPTARYNYAQTMSNSFEVTGEMLATDVRLDSNEYQDQKAECLKLHGRDAEEALMFSQIAQLTGSNDKRQRITQGLAPMIIGSASAITSDYRFEATVNDVNIEGDAWTTSGAAWLNSYFEQTALYGPQERTALCGNKVFSALNALAETDGTINLKPKDNAWGLDIMQWIIHGLKVNFISAPLMSIKAGWDRAAIIFPAEDIEYKYFQSRDTTFLPDPNREKAGSIGRDGIIEGYRTQFGLETHFEKRFMLLMGFGQENTQTP